MQQSAVEDTPNNASAGEGGHILADSLNSGRMKILVSKFGFTIYRVTYLHGKNLTLTWIWEVLPCCLVGSRQAATEQLPKLSKLSQQEVVT